MKETDKLPPRPGSDDAVAPKMSQEQIDKAPFALKLDTGVVMVTKSKAIEIMANLATQLSMRENG